MSFQENKEEKNIEEKQQDPNEYSEFNDSEINISSPTDESDDTPKTPLSEEQIQIDALKKELESVNAKLVETNHKMLRIAADADNTRKRLEKEKMDTRLYSIQEFARDLLPVIDSFEKALITVEENAKTSEQNTQISAVIEGVKLVSKIFQDAIKKHGIERLPGKDAPFNPMYHNALAKETDNKKYQSEVVIEEFVPGYKIGDRILRTALVKVGTPN